MYTLAMGNETREVKNFAVDGGLPKALDIGQQSDPLKVLEASIEEIGFKLGRIVSRYIQTEPKENHINVLITGPPASKKSTFIGLMRHLIESSGLHVEKIKDGDPEHSNSATPAEYTGAKPDIKADAVLWESTTILPRDMSQMDLYIELSGSTSARRNRLDNKTGSWELAMAVSGAATEALRNSARKPDLIMNTDAITIDFEQEGGTMRPLERGYRRGIEGSGISFPTSSENDKLLFRKNVLREIGLGDFLTEGQIEFLSMRLRHEGILRLPDGRPAISMRLMNVIIGENRTKKIPVMRVETPREIKENLPSVQESFKISKGRSDQNASEITSPNAWLTTTPSQRYNPWESGIVG